jgi:hypothetical protein
MKDLAVLALLVGALGTLPTSLASAQERAGWNRYYEPQAGASVDYPSGVFATPVGPSKRGIGRALC